MDSIQDIIKKASTASRKGVLATIIHIDGSAYRKAGAMMFITEDGLQMGMISGGCLEEDLEKRAIKLMHATDICAQTIRYDMTAEDDLGWGRGAGCNGVVHLLLEKVDGALKLHLHKMEKLLSQGLDVQVKKLIHPMKSYTPKRHVGNDVEMVRVETSIRQCDGTNPETANMKGTHQTIVTQMIKPKPRLVIFGAGLDVHPLAEMACHTGFSVTIWDWREALLKESFFPNATRIHSSSIPKAIVQAGITCRDYVVIMTHDFQMDQQILHAMLHIKGLQYLGVLGPRRRTMRLLHSRIDAIPSYIHSPIGLSIGADGPDEIAISILAELIKVKGEEQSEKRAFIGQQYHRHLSSSGKE